MDELLKLAIEAHGGLEHWREFNVVRANASITGELWHLKGQPDVLKLLLRVVLDQIEANGGLASRRWKPLFCTAVR